MQPDTIMALSTRVIRPFFYSSLFFVGTSVAGQIEFQSALGENGQNRSGSKFREMPSEESEGNGK